MASTAAIAVPPRVVGPDGAPPRIVRLWQDTARVEQRARFSKLELQAGDEYGERVWQLAHEQWRQLPEGTRIDLPSPRAFGRVLGVFRTGAMLKNGKMLQLELSAGEIAQLVGYSKSTVEAVLRWLGLEAILFGENQVARGLGFIHRGRRTAFGYLQGKLRRLYRTTRIVLTLAGRLLLGLTVEAAERRRERRQERAVKRKMDADTVAAHEDSPDPPTDPPVEPHTDAARAWIAQIKNALK